MGSSLEEELRFMSEGDVSILKGLSKSISLLKAKGEPTLMLLIEFIPRERKKGRSCGFSLINDKKLCFCLQIRKFKVL